VGSSSTTRTRKPAGNWSEPSPDFIVAVEVTVEMDPLPLLRFIVQRSNRDKTWNMKHNTTQKRWCLFVHIVICLVWFELNFEVRKLWHWVRKESEKNEWKRNPKLSYYNTKGWSWNPTCLCHCLCHASNTIMPLWLNWLLTHVILMHAMNWFFIGCM
jgi:hypothetical protein